MADDQIRSTVLPAPYLPFKTFLGSLDPFSQGIPPKLDRSLWNQSGFIQGLILNAYRFFHLVDATNTPTKEFQDLVKSKDDKRKQQIKLMLELGYPEIMMKDLETMTPKILDEQIERYNVTGDTKKKASTFFLQAAKYAGIPLSSFLTDKIRNTSGTKRRRKNNDDGSSTQIEKPFVRSSTQGSSRTLNLADGGTITLTISVDPFSLDKKDREFVFGLIDKLQNYEMENPSVDGLEDEEEV